MFIKDLYFKNFFNSFIAIFLVNIAITGLLYLFFTEKSRNDLYNNNTATAKINFTETKEYIESKIKHHERIINSIDNSKPFNIYLTNEDKNEIVDIFKIILESNKALFQIRFIDKNGLEKIRIDKDNANNVFEKKDLQDKSSRYYYTKTISLEKNEFYISDLDLNIEYGMIEIPYKPTIRISKPIYRDDTLLGMLIINYCADEILDYIRSKELFDVYYMDSLGNFFLHPDKKKNFSSQLKTNYKVEKEIPNIKALIDKKEKSNKYYLTEISITDNHFYIIYSLKDKVYEKELDKLKTEILYIFIIVFILTLPIIIFFLNKLTSQSTILETVIDNIPFPVFLKNLQGKIVLSNDSLVKLVGAKSKKDLIGKNISQLMDEKDALKINAALDKLNGFNFIKDEIEIYSKNGKKYFYDLKVIKISLFEIIKETFILGVAIDITEIKSLNLHLEDLVKKEVKKRVLFETALIHHSKIVEIDNMIDNMILQWKQPLNIIKIISSSNSFKIENNLSNQKELEKSFDEISKQIDILNLISDDFSKFFSSSKNKENFFVKDVVITIERLLEQRFKQQNIKIEKDIDKDAYLYGYESQMGQVLLNILNNCIEDFNNNIESNKIKISSFIQGDETLIIISSNGKTLTQDEITNKIFSQLFTSEESDNKLGLSISKTIIENEFHGKIEAYNKDDKIHFKIIIQKKGPYYNKDSK